MCKKDELNRIDGIYAWDTGCVSSGIKDDSFKEELKLNVNGKTNLLLDELASSYMNCGQGYTLEDISELSKWAADELGIEKQICVTLEDGYYGK